MSSLASVPRDICRGLKYIFTDVDGTITSGGVLVEEAYSALWALKKHGFTIIPVSGGAAGAAIHMARAWPVDAFATESGAAVFYFKDGRMNMLNHDTATVKATDDKALNMIEDMRRAVSGFKLAKDQYSRIYDIAIDYHEDAPFLDENEVNVLYEIARKHGAKTRRSSIHINAYFGNYNKLAAASLYFERALNKNICDCLDQCAFIGDAPNDKEMFDFFPISFGVSNIAKYLSELSTPPAYIADYPSGKGFAQIAALLCAEKNL